MCWCPPSTWPDPLSILLNFHKSGCTSIKHEQMAKILFPHSTRPHPGFTTASHLPCLPFSLMSFFRDHLLSVKSSTGCRGTILERNILETKVSWSPEHMDFLHAGLLGCLESQPVTKDQVIQLRWGRRHEKVLKFHNATLEKGKPWCCHPTFLALSVLLPTLSILPSKTCTAPPHLTGLWVRDSQVWLLLFLSAACVLVLCLFVFYCVLFFYKVCRLQVRLYFLKVMRSLVKVAKVPSCCYHFQLRGVGCQAGQCD